MIKFEQDTSGHNVVRSLRLDQLQIRSWFVFSHDDDIRVVLNQNAICDSDRPHATTPLQDLLDKQHYVPTVNLTTAKIRMFDAASRVYRVCPTGVTPAGCCDATIHWRHAQGRHDIAPKPSPTESMLVEALGRITQSSHDGSHVCNIAIEALAKHEELAGGESP